MFGCDLGKCVENLLSIVEPQDTQEKCLPISLQKTSTKPVFSRRRSLFLDRETRDVRDLYIMGESLQKFTFGTLIQAVNKETGENVVCKAIKKKKVSLRQDFWDIQREIEVLEKLSGIFSNFFFVLTKVLWTGLFLCLFRLRWVCLSNKYTWRFLEYLHCTWALQRRRPFWANLLQRKTSWAFGSPDFQENAYCGA